MLKEKVNVLTQQTPQFRAQFPDAEPLSLVHSFLDMHEPSSPVDAVH